MSDKQAASALVAAIRAACAGEKVWRCAGPDGAYCIEFDSSDYISPERACHEWFAEQVAARPQWIEDNQYRVVEARIFTQAERLANEAAAEITRLSAALDEALAQLEEERARNAAQAADENCAVDLLATVFAAYENGIPCYDDPDGEAGAFLGHAVRLDDDTFHACADILNRLRPAPPLAIITGDTGKRE